MNVAACKSLCRPKVYKDLRGGFFFNQNGCSVLVVDDDVSWGLFVNQNLVRRILIDQNLIVGHRVTSRLRVKVPWMTRETVPDPEMISRS